MGWRVKVLVVLSLVSVSSIVWILPSQSPRLEKHSGQCFLPEKRHTDLLSSIASDSAHFSPGAYRYKGRKSCFYPISFCVPREVIVKEPPFKTTDLAELLPGAGWTYFFPGRIWDRRAYFGMYQRSRFAVTFKKAGWDCARHYEILASGSIPVFVNVENAPEGGAMEMLPRTFLRHIQNASFMHTERNVSMWYRSRGPAGRFLVSELYWLKDPVFRGPFYEELVTQLLAWTTKHLSCEEVVSYMLKRSNNQGAKSALFISSSYVEDYMRDGLLIGFKRIFGRNLTEAFCIPHLRNTTDRYFSMLHSGRLSEESCITFSSDAIAHMIANKSFDLIVYGQHERTEFLPVVKQYYPKSQVLSVHAFDHPAGPPLVESLSSWSTLFMRESSSAIQRVHNERECMA